MNNIILNILNKKQNLSYPLIFKKIGKYFWDEEEIEKVFNVDIKDIINQAIINKWYRILKVLIHAGDDYALRRSIFYNHIDIVKYSIENGANIHAKNDFALRCAAENGHLDIVKYLVENKANIHVYNDYALRFSALYGHLQVVKYLVENGANIHAENNEPLRYAAEHNHLQVVKYLAEKM